MLWTICDSCPRFEFRSGPSCLTIVFFWWGSARSYNAPWPYLPLSLDSPTLNRRTSVADLQPVPGSSHVQIRSDVMPAVWESFKRHKASGHRDAYWMWHGQIKVRPAVLAAGERARVWAPTPK